nr:unnamed protein product [Callosobruchus analis]
MFIVILCTVIAVVLFVIKYEQYVMNKADKQLHWLYSVPGYPFLGNLFEFHGPRENLNDVRRLHATYGKTMLLRGPMQRMIVSCDYDFLEFVLSSPNILNKSADYTFWHRWLGTGLLTSDESTMGVPVNAQEEEDSEYVKNVKLVSRLLSQRTTTFYERPNWLYWLTPNYYRAKWAVEKIHDFTYSVINSRIQTLQNSGDDQNNNEEKAVPFLDMLLKSTVDGKPLSIEDIREEVDTFMFEGHDTTGSAISFALYLLASHQDVQDQALEEQKTIFCEDIHRSVTYNDLQRMKYLECVIKETLRLYPSVPFFGRSTHQPITYKGRV